MQTPWDNPKFRSRAIIGGVVALVGVLLIAILALQKPKAGSDQARIQSQETTTTSAANPTNNSASTPQPPASTTPSTPDRRPDPAPPSTRPDPSVTPPRPDPTPSPPRPETTPMPVDPPKKIDPPKVVPPPPPKYDQYGNLIGDVGLGQQDEFKGQRILFWGGHTALGKVFFAPKNPLWNALEDKGFAVRREFGEFKTEWLKSADQLWIVSADSRDIPPGITAEMIDEYVKQEMTKNPSGKRPFDWSDKNLELSIRSDLAVSLSPKFPMDDDAYAAVEQFIKAGKGVCLLADNDPFVTEANELAVRLYGVNVTGNYPGQKIAYIRQRELPEDIIRKFRGAYAVDDHPLLTGVNFVYEGITISNVGRSEQLEVAMKASDGKPLLAVSKVPGQRVVIDCGYTRYVDGTNDETSFIKKTAGTLRLAQNIAAYLAGKTAAKK